jgi:hypothetical protein
MKNYKAYKKIKPKVQPIQRNKGSRWRHYGWKQMLDIVDKDLKVSITNMFKELKETMFWDASPKKKPQ